MTTRVFSRRRHGGQVLFSWVVCEVRPEGQPLPRDQQSTKPENLRELGRLPAPDINDAYRQAYQREEWKRYRLFVLSAASLESERQRLAG